MRKAGRRAAAGAVRMVALPTPHSDCHVGIAAAGVCSAVERNRVRRRVRAAWREAAHGVGGLDVLVRVSGDAAGRRFTELVDDVRRCLLEVNRQHDAEAPRHGAQAN